MIKLGLKEVHLPKALSLTFKQASEWLVAQASVLKGYLEGLKVSLHEKVMELATKIDDFIIAGKNYLGLGKECKFDAGACFVAGTLVHTDKGLVPIEQLKVGDMVLSKHESGQGEKAYKRVISTFKSAEKLPIVRVSFAGPTVAEKRGEMHLFCTDNHPFWVVSKGWKLASQLVNNDYTGEYDELMDLNEKPINLRDWMCLLRTTTVPDIAVSANSLEWKDHDGFSMMIDFRSNKPILIGGGGSGFRSISNDKAWHPDEDIYFLPSDDNHIETQFYDQALEYTTRVDDELHQNAYRAYVYNIEVEDYHTYYVGKAGIWVHNTNNCTFYQCRSPYTIRDKYSPNPLSFALNQS